jgi:hypothetical protein
MVIGSHGLVHVERCDVDVPFISAHTRSEMVFAGHLACFQIVKLVVLFKILSLIT